jgi:Flp pilus assembly protein TadG
MLIPAAAPRRDGHWARASMSDQLKSRISARAFLRSSLPRLRAGIREGTSLPRCFLRHRQAATTVEFGLLAAPFVALTFAIMQTAMIFFAGQALETAAATAGRYVLTGEAQTQGWTAAQFKQQVCNAITGLFNCQNGIYIDVETYSTFAAANLGMPISNGNFNAGDMGYNPGGPGDIVVVRLYYQYPVYMNLLGFNLSDVNGGYDLLAATAVFKNEPYAS